MTRTTEGHEPEHPDPEDLGASGGVGIGAGGEPSTFEPEEDPESVDADGPSTPDEADGA